MICSSDFDLFAVKLIISSLLSQILKISPLPQFVCLKIKDIDGQTELPQVDSLVPDANL